jgi:alanyl aminopeptidase
MHRLIHCVRTLVVLSLTAGGLAATAQETASLSTENSPLGQLDKTVMPERYTLDLTIVPSRDRFRGEVIITVTLEQATNRIWLHGKGLDVREARMITARGDSIQAEYTQVHESGVARLDLERRAPAGRARLSFRYTAPFSEGLCGDPSDWL